jgi:hypothetical protein
VAFLKYEFNYLFARRFVLRPGLFLGSTLSSKNDPPPQHWFGFGGLNPKQYIPTSVPFTGVQFIQQFGYHAAVFRLDLQYNFFKKMYVTLLMDGGSNQQDIEDIFKGENFIFGYGAALSYDSFIGPLEITLMSSNLNSKPMLFLNLGFWL